jgi:NAD(P)-dependent dehydrogenase (short-subunit alcohol dehydrogenase family)
LSGLANFQVEGNTEVITDTPLAVERGSVAASKQLTPVALRSTPLPAHWVRGLGETMVAEMINASPLKRLGSVDNVAAMVLWLCSPASAFNAGAVFDMSGGRVRY